MFIRFQSIITYFCIFHHIVLFYFHLSLCVNLKIYLIPCIQATLYLYFLSFLLRPIFRNMFNAGLCQNCTSGQNCTKTYLHGCQICTKTLLHEETFLHEHKILHGGSLLHEWQFCTEIFFTLTYIFLTLTRANLTPRANLTAVQIWLSVQICRSCKIDP